MRLVKVAVTHSDRPSCSHWSVGSVMLPDPKKCLADWHLESTIFYLISVLRLIRLRNLLSLQLKYA